MLSVIWVLMVCTALVVGLCNGRLEAVGAAALTGASEAITLCLAIAGPICLWSGVMELMKSAGVAAWLSRCLRPALSKLFPQAAKEPETLEKISANVSANLLGLGNAATPLGVEAAKALHRHCTGDTASDELCRLVVLNTASLQLIPSTIAAVRAGLGAVAPFDILPAVWLTSLTALVAGLGTAWLCGWIAGRVKPCGSHA